MLKTQHQPEVTSSVPPSQEHTPPLPPPPLPPPNNPPPPTGNISATDWCPSHAVLAHTASSPAFMRQVSQSQVGHHQMLQNHSCVQKPPQPSPLRHNPSYTIPKGALTHCHANHHNPDYLSQSEMAYMQVAPPTMYCNSTPSPANSSSGYSSGTTQASHGSLYNNPRVLNEGSDLPPPPPPPPTQTSIQSPPPPLHAPPPIPQSKDSTDNNKTQ